MHNFFFNDIGKIGFLLTFQNSTKSSCVWHGDDQGTTDAQVDGILACFLRNAIDFSGDIDKAKELLIIIQFEVFFFDNWCKAHEMLNI